MFLFFLLFSLTYMHENTVGTPYYTSSEAYSLKILNKRGLPSIAQVSPPGTISYFANIDIPSREMLNLTFPYCYFKQTMEDWCCGDNKSACLPLQPRANSRLVPYSYCIITERWPQPNLTSWLENTVYSANNVSWIGYKMYCACRLPGRAVWISGNPQPQPEFNSCPQDNLLWSFHIIFCFLWACLLIYTIYGLIMVIQRLVEAKAHTHMTKTKSWLRVLNAVTIMWFIPCAVLQMINHSSVMYYKRDVRGIGLNTWTNIFSGLCILIGSTFVLFFFSSFAATIKSIKKHSLKRRILSITKWIYVMLLTPLFITMIAFNGVIVVNSYAAFEAFYFSDAAAYGNKAISYTIYQLDVSYAILGIIIVGFLFLIGFIFTQVGWNAWDKEVGDYKRLFIIRVYYLICATIAVCFFTATTFFFHYCLIVDTGAWFTNDEFYSNTAQYWGIFFNSFFKFFWVLFTLLAITVVRQKSQGESYESEDEFSDYDKTTKMSSNTSNTISKTENSLSVAESETPSFALSPDK